MMGWMLGINRKHLLENRVDGDIAGDGNAVVTIAPKLQRQECFGFNVFGILNTNVF